MLTELSDLLEVTKLQSGGTRLQGSLNMAEAEALFTVPPCPPGLHTQLCLGFFVCFFFLSFEFYFIYLFFILQVLISYLCYIY